MNKLAKVAISDAKEEGGGGDDAKAKGEMKRRIGKMRASSKLIAAAVKETRRMGQFGLTQSELERFGAALVTDSEQLAAMGSPPHGSAATSCCVSVRTGDP